MAVVVAYAAGQAFFPDYAQTPMSQCDNHPTPPDQELKRAGVEFITGLGVSAAPGLLRSGVQGLGNATVNAGEEVGLGLSRTAGGFSEAPGTILPGTVRIPSSGLDHVQIQGLDRVLLSSDPLVPDLVSGLEKVRPGIVKQVGTTINSISKKDITEIDIVTEKVLYQVKTGKAKGLVEQLQTTAENTQNREIVAIVTEKAGKHVVQNARDAGFKVIRVNSKDVNISEILSNYDGF